MGELNIPGEEPALGAEAVSSPPKRESYRSGFFFGTLSFGAAIAIGFVSTIITARLYGVVIIGEYALITTPVAAMWVLSTIKEQQSLIKEITTLEPGSQRVTQLFSAVFSFSIALTFTVATLVAAVCWFVFPGPLDAPDLLAPALVSLASYALITNTGWNMDSILSAFIVGRQIFWVRSTELIAFLVIATGIGLAWKSVWALVVATSAASLVALVHRAVVVRPFVSLCLTKGEYRIGLRALPDLLRFGIRAAPGQMAQGISQQGGIWAIGMVAPLTVVGAYSRALVVPQGLQRASMRFSEVLYPTLVGRHSAGDGHGFDRALIDSIRYEVVGLLLFAAAIGGGADSVLQIFGHGFQQAAPALVLLMFYPILAAVGATQTQALWATGRPGVTSLISMVRLVITVALLVFLTPSMHMIGPAMALLGGSLVLIGISGLALRRHLARPLRLTWSRRERSALVIAYAAGFAASYATQSAIDSGYGLPLYLLVGAIAYGATFVAVGGLNSRDRDRIADGMAKLRRNRPIPSPQEPAVRSSICRSCRWRQGKKASSSPGWRPSK
jgi:O-antigen/teichoic acid export membrane protein